MSPVNAVRQPRVIAQHDALLQQFFLHFAERRILGCNVLPRRNGCSGARLEGALPPDADPAAEIAILRTLEVPVAAGMA